jgi:hypothetical protein
MKLVLMLLLVGWSAAACNPKSETGLEVRDDVGIRDFFTLRSIDGSLQTRDVMPEPKPREAITGDDYFQLKLEQIYIGDVLDRDVGNLAIIAGVDGIIPKGVVCEELSTEELGFELPQRQTSSVEMRSGCMYKTVLSVNPVFKDSNITIQSAFITPPFRMGKKPIKLHFVIGQLNDVEIARQLLKWGQEQLSNLSEWGLEEIEFNKWQSKLVNIGFTLANYLLDYMEKPDYVFEFQTDFVPIESVRGVNTPQNLFMGGDFIIVGFPKSGNTSALQAVDQLVFNSGSLMWKKDNSPYKQGPYIVFKVVRQSRYPQNLPVNLGAIDRGIERDRDPFALGKAAKNIILDLQDAVMLNETEGRYLRDLVEWYVDVRALSVKLKALVKNIKGTTVKVETEDYDAEVLALPAELQNGVATYGYLLQIESIFERANSRIYDYYGTNPGINEDECRIMTGVLRDMADAYRDISKPFRLGFERVLDARSAIDHIPVASRTPQQVAEFKAVHGFIGIVGELYDRAAELPTIPECPNMRQ